MTRPTRPQSCPVLAHRADLQRTPAMQLSGVHRTSPRAPQMTRMTLTGLSWASTLVAKCPKRRCGPGLGARLAVRSNVWRSRTFQRIDPREPLAARKDRLNLDGNFNDETGAWRNRFRNAIM